MNGTFVKTDELITTGYRTIPIELCIYCVNNVISKEYQELGNN